MTYRRKLIEVALPLEAINKESGREKSVRHGHPMHSTSCDAPCPVPHDIRDDIRDSGRCARTGTFADKNPRPVPEPGLPRVQTRVPDNIHECPPRR
jgi:hypothetical protein